MSKRQRGGQLRHSKASPSAQGGTEEPAETDSALLLLKPLLFAVAGVAIMLLAKMILT